MTSRVYLDNKPQGTTELEPHQIAEQYAAIVWRVNRSAKWGTSIYLRKPRRANKWQYLYVVQGFFGYGYGWEDVTQSDSPWEAHQDLKAYRENDPDHVYRRITRRELNPEAVTESLRALLGDAADLPR